MAMTSGLMAPIGRYCSSSSIGGCAGRFVVLQARRSSGDVRCSATSGSESLLDQYTTLRVQPGASELEVKKAFRQLVLQYHPDVCKGNNYRVEFHKINEAYDIVMSGLRQAEEDEEQHQWQPPEWGGDDDELMRGMWDPSWELWEEWMGWEGAGIRDYSSHINPYI